LVGSLLHSGLGIPLVFFRAPTPLLGADVGCVDTLVVDLTRVLCADGKALVWTQEALFTTVLEHDGALARVGRLVGPPPGGDSSLGLLWWGLSPGLGEVASTRSGASLPWGAGTLPLGLGLFWWGLSPGLGLLWCGLSPGLLWCGLSPGLLWWGLSPGLGLLWGEVAPTRTSTGLPWRARRLPPRLGLFWWGLHPRLGFLTYRSCYSSTLLGNKASRTWTTTFSSFTAGHLSYINILEMKLYYNFHG